MHIFIVDALTAILVELISVSKMGAIKTMAWNVLLNYFQSVLFQFPDVVYVLDKRYCAGI